MRTQLPLVLESSSGLISFSLVVFDTIHLPLGNLRLRPQGGSGGHNGLKSIFMVTDTQTIPRLSVGVGAPAQVYMWVWCAL